VDCTLYEGSSSAPPLAAKSPFELRVDLVAADAPTTRPRRLVIASFMNDVAKPFAPDAHVGWRGPAGIEPVTS
jgi:hypothetical protein